MAGWDLAMVAATLVAMLVVARTVPVKAGPRWAAFVAVDGLALGFVVVAIGVLAVWPEALGIAAADTAMLLALVIVPYGLLAAVILFGVVLLPLRKVRPGGPDRSGSGTVRR